MCNANCCVLLIGQVKTTFRVGVHGPAFKGRLGARNSLDTPVRVYGRQASRQRLVGRVSVNGSTVHLTRSTSSQRPPSAPAHHLVSSGSSPHYSLHISTSCWPVRPPPHTHWLLSCSIVFIINTLQTIDPTPDSLPRAGRPP